MSIRRQARELALQLLYSGEFANAQAQGRVGTIDPKALFREFAVNFSIERQAREERELADYAEALFVGVNEHLPAIDALIQSHARHWKIARMALVDLAILRLACFEIKFADPLVSPAVVINEAIELARQYGTTDSASFVNGILDPIAHHL